MQQTFFNEIFTEILTKIKNIPSLKEAERELSNDFYNIEEVGINRDYFITEYKKHHGIQS